MFKYLFSKKSLSINGNTPPCIIVSSNRLISGRSSREIPRLYGEDSEGTPWLNAPSQRADSRVYMPWRERAHIRVSLYYAAWNAKLRRDLMTPAITQPRVWRICLIELTVYTHDQHSRLRQWRNWLTHRRVNFENSRATVASIPTETRHWRKEGERKRCANKALGNVLPDTDYKMEGVLSLYKDKSVEVEMKTNVCYTDQSRLHVAFGYIRSVTFFLIVSVAHRVPFSQLTKKRLI